MGESGRATDAEPQRGLPEEPHLRLVPPQAGPAGGDPSASSDAEDAFLFEELRTVRDELARLEELLEEMPAIYEAKFRQRLRALLAEQRVLEARNRALEQELLSLAPQPSTPRCRGLFGGAGLRALLAPIRRR